MLDKGAEIIRQAKEERKNTKMDKTRIIVVEDNIVYCEFVCNLLAREGFRTVQAYHPLDREETSATSLRRGHRGF